ncbi:hypothetical protein [Acinetobacter sp. YH12239]|uniref:hypothetical protein n=1 Tax=Acinetobacter sp. YH12239 TaxID=2601166 RepID=UPI0015D1F2ED|nr:hypothetical protein [Acinetobacter sp. YH12239]
MSKLIKNLYAIGTRGGAFGKVFKAKKNKNSKYVLNIRRGAYALNPTNYAINKVELDTLEEVYEVLKQEQHVINVTDDSGNRALLNFKSIKVEYF